MKDKVDGSHNTLNRELRDKLHNLCAEMGLDYPEIELGVQYGEETDVDMSGAKARENYRIRLLEARKLVRKLIFLFTFYAILRRYFLFQSFTFLV